MSVDYSFELFILPTVIFVFVALSFILLGLIIHLTLETRKAWNNKKTKKPKKLSLILGTTIFAIISFDLSLVCIIILVLQVYLLDTNIRDEALISDKFFAATHDTFEYLIAVLDSFGHLAMLFVFIIRFHFAFSNPIFRQSQVFIHCLYVLLVALFITSFVIIFYVFPTRHNKQEVLIWEITWEICVESTVLFILILFAYNLYNILKISVINQLKNGNKNDILEEITKISLERSKSSRDKKKVQMTIDGTNVRPMPPSRNATTKSTLSVMRLSNYMSSDEDPEIYISDNDENIAKKETVRTHSPSPRSTPTTTPRSMPSDGHNDSVEILAVMNKMTVLVIVAAIVSFVTIAGNFVIECYGKYNEKDIASDDGLDHDVIWVMILPVFDMFATSVMLYLQFNFTHRSYKRICRCVDTLFLKCMLRIIKHTLNKEQRDEQTASFIMNNAERDRQMSAIDVGTKTTVTISTPASPTDMAPIPPNEIELEIQNSMK